MGKLKIDEIINRDIKIFRNYEFIAAEGDDWGKWQINIVEWLLKDFNLDIFNKRGYDKR